MSILTSELIQQKIFTMYQNNFNETRRSVYKEEMSQKKMKKPNKK